MKAFVNSRFGYYPLIWMFQNRINRIHERVPRIVYLYKISNFTELLKKDNAVTGANQRNFQVLASKIDKVKVGFTSQLRSLLIMMGILDNFLRVGNIVIFIISLL